VVSSGGHTVQVWKVNTSPAPDLVQEFATADIENGQAPGAFTSVSSNGVSANTAVIWALGRPLDQMEDDVREGIAAWYARMGGAWDLWMNELGEHRARIARLLNAPRSDCVVPRTSVPTVR